VRPAAPEPVAAAVKPVPAPPPPRPAAAAPAPRPPAPAEAGPWTVEANPTRSQYEAQALADQLRRRGYDVALTHVVRDGEIWYRLRVGRYATSEQASQMMRRLREQEGVTHAFVASEQ
jgi:cell division septation protein DedD